MRKKKKAAKKDSGCAALDKSIIGSSAQIIIGNLRYVYLHEVAGAGNFGLGKDEVLKKLEVFLKSAKKVGVELEEITGIFDLGMGVACVVRLEDLNRGVRTLGLENGLLDVRKMLVWVEQEVVAGIGRVFREGGKGLGLEGWKRALKRFSGGKGAGAQEIDYDP